MRGTAPLLAGTLSKQCLLLLYQSGLERQTRRQTRSRAWMTGREEEGDEGVLWKRIDRERERADRVLARHYCMIEPSKLILTSATSPASPWAGAGDTGAGHALVNGPHDSVWQSRESWPMEGARTGCSCLDRVREADRRTRREPGAVTGWPGGAVGAQQGRRDKAGWRDNGRSAPRAGRRCSCSPGRHDRREKKKKKKRKERVASGEHAEMPPHA